MQIWYGELLWEKHDLNHWIFMTSDLCFGRTHVDGRVMVTSGQEYGHPNRATKGWSFLGFLGAMARLKMWLSLIWAGTMGR